MAYRDLAKMKATLRAYYLSHQEQSRVSCKASHDRHREALRAYDKAVYEANKECRQAKGRAYAASHREERRAYNLKYYAERKESQRERARIWKTANPTMVRQHRQTRVARLAGVENTLTLAEWEAIKAAYGLKCAYCGKKPRLLTQDHVIPLSSGGGTVKENIVPSCKSCNSSKHVKLPVRPIALVLI